MIIYAATILLGPNGGCRRRHDQPLSTLRSYAAQPLLGTLDVCVNLNWITTRIIDLDFLARAARRCALHVREGMITCGEQGSEQDGEAESGNAPCRRRSARASCGNKYKQQA